MMRAIEAQRIIDANDLITRWMDGKLGDDALNDLISDELFDELFKRRVTE